MAKNDIITVCCVCHKIKVNGVWSSKKLLLVDQVDKSISHGYCDECLVVAYKDIKDNN